MAVPEWLDLVGAAAGLAGFGLGLYASVTGHLDRRSRRQFTAGQDARAAVTGIQAAFLAVLSGGGINAGETFAWSETQDI